MRTLFLATMIGTTALASSALAATPPSDPGANQAQAQNPAQQENLTAATLRNQPLFNQGGQQLGVIQTVVEKGADRPAAVLDRSGSGKKVMVPIDQISLQGGRYTTELDQNRLNSLPTYDANSTAYRQVPEQQKLALAQGGSQETAAASQITVKETAPQIEVSQPQPRVTVHQALPQIVVHQPAPTVTVNIPKPEITVRMPRPNVQISQAQPQVNVVQNGQQPQVAVQRDQNAENGAQADVRYESAQPKVIVNQDPGAPKVRYEQADGTTSDQQGVAGSQKQADNARPPRSAEQRNEYLQRFGQDAGKLQNSQEKEIRVSELNGKGVYNFKGDKLGTVDRTILNKDENKRYIIVAHGGFLGIGEDQVAFPLNRFAMEGDRLVIHGVTGKDIDNMDYWRDHLSNFKNLPNNDQIQMATVQPGTVTQ